MEIQNVSKALSCPDRPVTRARKPTEATRRPDWQAAGRVGREKAQLVVWLRLTGRWRMGLERSEGTFR